MNHETIEYFDGEHKLIGELIYNQSSSPQPSVIIFHAFEGRGVFTLNYAKSIAEKGYSVFVADMYGNAETSSTFEGCIKLVTPFLHDRKLVRKRALLAYHTLLKQKNINQHKIGALGFCFGGMCVLELARAGVDLHAAITLHGVLSKSDLPTNPIKSKILILHGYKDPQVPPTQLQPFAQEMEEAGVNDWTVTFFGNAKHSFTDPKTGTFDLVKEKEMGREYNSVVDARSFEYAMDFFKEHLNYEIN